MSAETPRYEYKGRCESCPYVKEVLAHMALLRESKEQLIQVLGIDEDARQVEVSQDSEVDFGIDSSTEVEFLLDDVTESDVASPPTHEELVRAIMEAQLRNVRDAMKQGDEILQKGITGCDGPTLLQGISVAGGLREAYVCESPELRLAKPDGSLVNLNDVNGGDTFEGLEQVFSRRFAPPEK